MLENFDPETNGESKGIVADNIAQLKQLFPEVFTEDKVDFTALKAALGEYIETSDERYNFTWHGKAHAKRIAQTSSTGTLRPCKEESKNWDSSQNLFIEGDNLEVLKLLQKAYHKQVKMIYIDPPYNTGKEFIYPDNYQDNLDTYLEYTGQKDSEGRKFGTNAETSGRYHTNWLNMMYPRLKLARNLLRDDGVIFISIDDNEVANLRKICDEIFGEENFLAEFIWKKRTGSNDAQNMVSLDHDYVMAFSKSSDGILNGELKDSSNYKNPDNDPRGPWAKDNLTCNKTASERPNLYYPITDPETGIVYDCNPNRVWAYEKSRMDRIISEGKVLFPKHGKGTPMYKRHLSELRSDRKPFSSIINTVINTVATKETRELFGKQLFDYPKSVDLLGKLIQQASSSNDVVMDFFSGSCTSAHAVINTNANDSGTRKFIMVQLPEPCNDKSEAYKNGFKTIADIGKERIRLAGEKIKAENTNKEEIENLDIGFKVFKLASSNIKPWDADFERLEDDLYSSVDNIKEDRSSDDVLYELLLKYGIDLTIPIESHAIEGKTVYSVGLGALLICLDDEITLDVVEGIGRLKEELQPETVHVVLKDAGLKDDVVKTNAIQLLKRYDINDVKTL
jgi:adenine-specific DNA-methyltransferase